MKTTPPQVLSDYFAAVNDGRTDDAVLCFAADALVHDESHDHQGWEAIRTWIAETTQKYQPKVEVLSIQDIEGALVATGSVSGTFPGSPVQLEYTFTDWLRRGPRSSLRRARLRKMRRCLRASLLRIWRRRRARKRSHECCVKSAAVWTL